jgi:hypothetical protein
MGMKYNDRRSLEVDPNVSKKVDIVCIPSGENMLQHELFSPLYFPGEV